MSRLLITGLAAIAMLMVASTAMAQDQALIDKGLEIYDQQRCSMCHSVDGKDNARGALDGVGTRLTAEDVKAWLLTPKEMTEKTGAERKPNMRAYPQLEEGDMEALVAYMLSLKEK
jgi:mono/diheme cytochrome c family protein